MHNHTTTEWPYGYPSRSSDVTQQSDTRANARRTYERAAVRALQADIENAPRVPSRLLAGCVPGREPDMVGVHLVQPPDCSSSNPTSATFLLR